jgi:hypothetical protein
MSNIHDIRQSIDRKLDRWEVRASTIEAHIDTTKDDASARVEAQKARLRGTLDRFETRIAEAQDLNSEKKAEVHTQVDNFKVQLALGKTDARDAYDEQNQKIRHAWTEFAAAVDHDVDALDEDMQTIERELVAEVDKLDAELDGMKLQFAKERDEVRQQLADGKTEFNGKIKAFKATIAEKRGRGKEKAAELEQELSRQSKEIWQGLLDQF